MSFLNEIYSEIEKEFTEIENGQALVAHMSAFYTLINYLELTDNGSGLQENDIRNRFYQRKEYKTIIEKLINHKVLVKSEDGLYFLNKQAKELISPIFNNLMAIPEKKLNNVPKHDPSLNLLYNYNSKFFISE